MRKALGILICLIGLPAFGATYQIDLTHSGLDIDGQQANVTGYTVYYGSASGSYDASVPVSVSDPSVSIDHEGPFYAVATATNADGESSLSSEVHPTPPTSPSVTVKVTVKVIVD